MKNNIYITFDNSIYSEAIQKFLLKKGFEWITSGREVITFAQSTIEVRLSNKKIYIETSRVAPDFEFPKDLAKIEQAITSKIKEGDYVRLTDDGDHWTNHSSYSKGDIYQVGQVQLEDHSKHTDYAWIRERRNDGKGVSTRLLEIVTKADYDAYMAAKQPKLTFGDEEVRVSKNVYGQIKVTTQGVVGSLEEIEAIVERITRKATNLYKFGSVQLKSWKADGKQTNFVPNTGGQTVDSVTIGCTTGTLEELQAIIKAGNKLK